MNTRDITSLYIVESPGFSLSAEEAIHGPESVKWKEAMQIEIDVLLKNDTWKLVTPLENRNVISNKMDFDQEI